MFTLKKTKEFSDWLETLTEKEKKIVAARLERIKNLGHFGDVKPLGNHLAELRWKNGWRVYFAKDTVGIIVLLLGGHKNDQKKDINKAKILIGRYTRS